METKFNFKENQKLIFQYENLIKTCKFIKTTPFDDVQIQFSNGKKHIVEDYHLTSYSLIKYLKLKSFNSIVRKNYQNKLLIIY